MGKIKWNDEALISVLNIKPAAADGSFGKK